MNDLRPEAPDVTKAEPQAGCVARFSHLALKLVFDPDAVERDWRRLEKLARNSLHQGFDWCTAWSEAHRRPLVIVEGSSAGKTFLLLPLELVSEQGLRIARFPGGRFNNINSGLFDEHLAIPDAEELHNFVHDLRLLLKDVADLLLLDGIPLLWRGVVNPLSGLLATENQNRSFQLPLVTNFEATISQLNAKSRRKRYRSSMRRFDSIGGCEHVIETDPEKKHALLDLFFEQKGERLREAGLPDIFAVEETRSFFHRLLDAQPDGMNSPLTLHALTLKGENAGRIAAISGLSVKGDHVICQFGSIDDSICPDASPGDLLFWIMIEHSCRSGAAVFDFGIGDQPYKRNWCRQETVHYDILIPISWKGASMRPLLIGLTRMKSIIKRYPTLYGLVQRWRSRLTVRKT